MHSGELPDFANPNLDFAMMSPGRELRNSKSTTASGQQRKEVFSKTRFINENGIPMT